MFAKHSDINTTELPIEYTDIFNQRAGSYHFAMANWPLARHQEFDALLQYTNFKTGQQILDYPSGGGYLSRFVPHDIQLTHIESCETFERFCRLNSAFDSELSKQGKLPKPDNSIDWFLSLAGLHHESNKQGLFTEISRVLKPGGQLVIGDASQDSKTALFLDEWMGQFNPMGHHGQYFNKVTLQELEDAGLTVKSVREEKYHWVFKSKQQAAHYCQQLFGISLATVQQVETALDRYLGFENLKNGIGLKWQLQFIHCQK
jgi:SAM-dependent methyltransferase